MTGTQADFDTTKQLLASAGIPIVGQTTRSLDEAQAAAAEAGFPVVMKLISAEVVHKTDVGAVLLDIPDPDGVAAAWVQLEQLAAAAGATRVDGVLVQPMARSGFELLVGARQDPVFGPVTMIGYGGRFVELFKDVAPGVGVLTPDDVEAMLDDTLAGQVLDGFRGPPLDRAAVVQLAIAVSRLMEGRPDITELDLNPVIVYPEGFLIVDARVILGEPVYHPRAWDLSEDRLASLQAIFAARSVAVVGASRPGTVGGIILKNSSAVERLYPINPRRETLLGRPCFPSLEELPETPDVAVFAVRPELTVSGYESFCDSGGKGAIIVSDGFAEIGRHDLEGQLRATSKRHGVVYIGPNGLGVLDNFSGLNTLFLPTMRTHLPRRAGPIGIISQSGGVGIELLEMAAADNLAIGKFVSCGNASGVSIAELLAHMGGDDRIKIIAIYMEGLRNGLQFMEVGRKVAEHKPVIVIKGGMAGGAAATMSHTASLAGSFEAFKAACRQAGFTLLEELTEDPKFLSNVLSILTTQKPARGRRIGVVSVGGGAAILLADQLTSQGMELAEFAPDSRERLARLLEHKFRAATAEEKQRVASSVSSNPIDLFGDANDDRVLEALHILDQDPNTDAIVLAAYFHVPYLTEYLPERLVELQHAMSKPLIMSLRGFSPYVFRSRTLMVQDNVTTYTVPMIKPLSIALDIWQRYGTDFRT